MSTDEDPESTAFHKPKFNKLKFFSEIKNRIFHSARSSNKVPKKNLLETFDDIFKSDNSSQSSKKSLLNKSTEKAFKKEFKASRISRSRASLFLHKSLGLSKNSKKKISLSPEQAKMLSEKKNCNQREKISRSLNSLGCSSTNSDFSSPISSFSSISVDEKIENSKKYLPVVKNLNFSKEKNFKKIKDLINLMNGSLIKDYSDLLVDHEHRFILSDDINEDSLGSLLTDTSSIDLTDGISTSLNKIFKLDTHFGTEVDKLIQDEEKMLKILIGILVKSCRIFDVATMKTDYKLSYWRYANPVIAVLKFNASKMTCRQKSSVAVQTEFEEKNDECLIESNENGLSEPQPIYENEAFYKQWHHNPIYENLGASICKILRTNFCLYENSDFFKDEKNQHEPKTSFETTTNEILLKKVNYGIRDETLRDAENMSDLESDSDKWTDWRDEKQDFILINNTSKNMDTSAHGYYLNEKKNEPKKIINTEIGHKNNLFRKNSILSLSCSSSSSSSMSRLTWSNYSNNKNIINSLRESNFKRPKSNNNDNYNDHGYYYKKSRSKLKTNSNIKWLSRTGQQGCLYKKDKNKRKFFNFIRIDNRKKKSNILAKITPSSPSNKSAHRLCSMMHEYQNTKSLETFLKKYESQSLSFKSETKFKNLNQNQMSMMSSPLVRTHSLDSLEEEKNEEFIVECGTDLGAEFDQNEQTVLIESKQKNSYTIGDLKTNSAKFNEESLIKQRARESLKFWKTEEEKLKQDTEQLNSSTIVQNSIFNSPNPFTSSLKRVTSREKSNTLSEEANAADQLKEKAADTDQQVPSKRVKDRINIFESKFQENKSNAPVTKIKKGSQSSFEPKSNFDLIRPVLDSKDIQTRIESFEHKTSLEIRNEEFCSQSYIETNDDETVTSTKIIEFEQNVNNEHEQEKSDSYDSDKNQFEETFFENQIIEYKCDKREDGQTKISTCSLDKQKTINLSLNSISSEYVLDNVGENEDQNEAQRDKQVECEQKELRSHVSIEEEDKRSSISLQNSVSKSEESEEEVEIVIDLNKDMKKTFDDEKINETLRNIVMHLIPTTRKAYVDDIVDGIKCQLTIEELDAIESPLDLSRDLIRFVQKRYSSLLSENYEAEKPSAKQTSLEIIVDSDRDSVHGELAKSNFEETTELTMVKEMREVVSDSDSKLTNCSNFIKVDEETLYIVEKIRQIRNKCDDDKQMADTLSVNRSNSTVENEIRKNFELKPKYEENLDKIKKDTDFKILINDLKKSIFKSNLHFSEMQSHGLINEINDYQLHYFDMDTKKNQQASILVILFDKQNEDNLKYNLEQNYQKSIVDTHLSLNRKANINIVAHMNLYYIDDIDSDISLKDEFCQSHSSYINLVNNSKFYDFSIFKRLRDAHQLSHLTDVSTYFLPIGKYFVKVYYKHVIHTNDMVLNQVINETRTEKESIIDLSLLPLAIRAQLVHECEMFMEQNRNDELPHVNMLAVDSFLLQMEINKKRDDLIRNIIVKNLNYTAKQADEFLSKKKSFNEMENLNEFITRLEADLDSYYICEKVDSLTKENQVQRSNEDLVKLNKLDALASFKCVQKYQIEMHDILRDTCFKYQRTNDIYQKFYLIDNGNHYKCMLPKEDLVESVSNSIKDNENKNLTNSSLFMENIQKRQNYIFDKDLQNVFTHQSSAQSEKKAKSDKVKKNMMKKVNRKFDINTESSDLRHKVISNAVYKMFNTVRDHQSSSVKAKGEMNIRRRKKYATWSYSSNKRHVIAKVMELPYADDMSILSKKTGISDLKDLEKSILSNDEDACEKVFVRIDDFLNKQVSQSIQRSYSFDYLNKHAGPRHRIKYVKIPNQAIKTFYLPSDLIQQANEYRTAPYDLRYLSILKLLEEERLSKAKSCESIDAKKHTDSNSNEILNKSSEHKEKKRFSVNEQPVNKSESRPKSTFIIKERTKNLTPSSIILNRIDSEMEKISLKNPSENVRIYDSSEQIYPLYTQDMDSLKEFLNTDVLYYDYETSNLMKLNESKNAQNLFAQNNQKQHTSKNSLDSNNVSFSSPNVSTWIPKNSRYEELTDELLKNQKNLYQIVDFQEQVIKNAVEEISQPRGKLIAGEKNDFNIRLPKMSNVQSLIIPNKDNASFEAEKFKRNI